MSTMLNEEGYSFKELEKEIFRMVCEWGQVTSGADDDVVDGDYREV